MYGLCSRHAHGTHAAGCGIRLWGVCVPENCALCPVDMETRSETPTNFLAVFDQTHVSGVKMDGGQARSARPNYRAYPEKEQGGAQPSWKKNRATGDEKNRALFTNDI